MINQDIAICLICYKTDNCDDNPLAVLISREGLTEKVFRNVRNTRDLFNMDNLMASLIGLAVPGSFFICYSLLHSINERRLPLSKDEIQRLGLEIIRNNKGHQIIHNIVSYY